MSFGKLRNFFIFFILIFLNNLFAFGADKIESVPLINLEELSPTFEEGKDELEKTEDKNAILNNITDSYE